MQSKLSYAGVALLVVACGSGQDKRDNRDVGMGTNYDPSQTGMGDSELEKEKIDDGSKEFDKEMAKRVLERSHRRAKECSKTTDASPGEGELQVVFDGEAGKIVAVELPSPWADASAAAQACIKNAFIDEYVPPFDGEKVTVPYTVTIPDPAEAKKDEKKDAKKK